MYRIYKKILHLDEGNFNFLYKKWYILKEILQLISGSSMKMREISHVSRVLKMSKEYIGGGSGTIRTKTWDDSTGTVRSKLNLLVQFILFNFQKNKKLRLSFHLF